MRNKELYPENWTDTIRPTILKRDNYRCKLCNIKQRSYVLIDSKGIKTTIDKDEFEEYKPFGARVFRVFLQISHTDNNKSNCIESNLITLCPWCHLSVDKEYKRILRKAPAQKPNTRIV